MFNFFGYQGGSGCDDRLMSKRYVTSLIRHKENELFILGLWENTGFKQVQLTANKHSRGQTTYKLRRRISLMVNAITSFSNKPLKYIFYLGALISFISFVTEVI